MGSLTNRDKAANDVRHLLALQNPRTDAPLTLDPPAVSSIPLPCEDDDETIEDLLMKQRAELRVARRTGVYRDRAVEQFPIPRTQYSFLAVALLRAIENTEYPDRVAWIEEFKRIKNGVDAAQFMTEAKLKVRYGMDMKKFEREGKEAVDIRGTVFEKLGVR
jgi:hypothetical protein